jgi:hypothetical protein
MKIKIEELRDMVHRIVQEAAAEGKFQKYAKGTYASMIKLASTGGNKNTPPYTKRSKGPGKSAPPGNGET